MSASQSPAPAAGPESLLAQLIRQAGADRARRGDELLRRPAAPPGPRRAARPPAAWAAQMRRPTERKSSDGAGPVPRRGTSDGTRPAPHRGTPFLGSTRPAGPDGALSRPPSLSEGTRIQGRALGRQGRQTVHRLREAGLAEFRDRGFHAVRVDDVVRRAGTSHGTFYLYFASKEDLLRTLLHDALHDMRLVADDFPTVTPNAAGRAALHAWVQRFGVAYAAHATVIRILSQAEITGEEIWADSLQLLGWLADAITRGMRAAAARGGPSASDGGGLSRRDELTAIACLMMLERVNYLLSAKVGLPRAEMTDRLTAIIYAAFQAS